MTYVLRFLPIVEEDALAGYAWYEEKAGGLGGEFLRMFYACAREILRNPLLYPQRFIVNFGVVYSGDFHMPPTFG
jgi:hypothetical protein